MTKPESNIHKLVSLTFDEKPEVRKEAAKALEDIDDPAALFALLELSYDKDEGVKKVALDILEKKKSSEKELMSFAEIFQRKEERDYTKKELKIRKEKVLEPISQLFERTLGKEKAEAVKKKMMPAIENIYKKNARIRFGSESDDNGKRAMQEFLTSYLDAVSSVETEREEAEAALPVSKAITVGEDVLFEQTKLDGELDLVGTKETELDRVTGEVGEIEDIEMTELVERRQEDELKTLPDTMFKKAYETMMLSNGDEKLMKKEMKRMLKDAERQIRVAFKLARRKFKENNITHITQIMDGMRNVNTELLDIIDVKHMEYPKGREMRLVTRVLVNDEEKNEGVVYIFEDRGSWLEKGMKIRIVKGYVKMFKFSNETALTISSKGNVYIVL